MRLTKTPGMVRNIITRTFNGVAGHAGLFSSASDLAIFATMYLNHGESNGEKIFSKSTIDSFSKNDFLPIKIFPFRAFNQNPAVHEKNKNIIMKRPVVYWHIIQGC